MNCPCCGQLTRTYSRTGDKGRMVETLHCDNPECGSRILQRFVHFAEKKAMNMSSNIHEWFRNSDHLLLWRNLQKELNFENCLDAEASGEENNMNGTNNNKFAGCTIAATGKIENFTRDGINTKIISLGATPGSSVTKKTDYLICGEKAGSKLTKAQQLGN